MTKIMTFEEIQQNYVGEWVLIAYKEADGDTEVVRGTVLAHSPNKQDIFQHLETTKEDSLTIEYIDDLKAEDLAFIL